MESDISYGKKLYREKNTTIYNWRFMAYPVIFYTIIMLVTLDAKYDFLKLRSNDSSRSEIEDGTIDVKPFRSRSPHNTCQLTWSDQTCTVTCQSTTDQTMVSDLNRLDISVCRISILELVLKNMAFRNNSIQKGWLSGCTRNVTKLEIYSSTELSDIGDEAFAGQPFTKLQYLIIEETGISNLRRNSFLGTEIVYLEIRFNSLKPLRIEFGVLNPLATTLSSFQLSNGICEPEAIRNLTGTGNTTLVELKVLDLRFNKLEIIGNRSFIDITSLVSLFLSNSRIKYIETEAFSGLGKTLQILKISDNAIETLREGVFNGFIISGSISINENPWSCNCTLEWMKYFYIKKMQTYFANGSEPFQCLEDGEYKNYTDVDFCPLSTSSTSTSTELSTSHTNLTTLSISSSTLSNVTAASGNITTSPSTTNDNFSCSILEDELVPMWRGHNYNFKENRRINDSKIIYHFQNIDDTSFFELEMQNARTDGQILWINSKDQENYGCVGDIHGKIKLDVLEYGQSYFLCLLSGSEGKINPFDCTTLVVPLEWAARTWIPNRFKYAVIGGVLSVILVVILLTIAIIFLVLDKNPRFMRTYRKYMVNHNFLGRKCAPSMYSTSDGYLIPNIYEKIDSRRSLENEVCYDCRVRELPPSPPIRSRKLGEIPLEKNRFHSDCSIGHGDEVPRKSISESRDYLSHRNYRSASIPRERISPGFEF